MKKITRQRQQQKTMQKIYQSSRFYDKNALRKLKIPDFSWTHRRMSLYTDAHS